VNGTNKSPGSVCSPLVMKFNFRVRRKFLMSEFSNRLLKFSPIDLQLYASKSLNAYCAAKSIQHVTVDELIAHLNSRPEGRDLAEWERRGALLPLNGRGDDMPQELRQSIPSQDIDDFCHIVDSAVEVGIVDVYGTPSELPAKFVEKITSILRKNHIDIPQF